MAITGLNPTPALFPQSNVEQLQQQKSATLDQEKARLKKVTEEFESFFMYYMLKTMRETVPQDPLEEDKAMFSGGMGKDVFNQMFDLEISKGLSTGGHNSISEILYDSMEKLVETRYEAEPKEATVRPLRSDEPQKALELHRQPVKLDRDETKTLKAVKKPERFIEVNPAPKKIKQDRILSDFGEHINEAAKLTSLDPALIYSVIKVESNGDPQAVSGAGAKGLMQLADTTAGDYGVSRVFDPGENIRAGSKYLANLIDRYGDLKLALAAYNAGPGNVDKYGGIPPFKETQQYVGKVIDTLKTTGAVVPTEAIKAR
jgi:Rod binding domain-containing protein